MMETFLTRSVRQDDVVGTLSMFDRMIFKDYLTGFFPKGAFGAYLWRKRVLLKDFGDFVQERTRELKAHIEELAKKAGRPVQYLASSKESKEDLARAPSPSGMGLPKGWCASFRSWKPACRLLCQAIARRTNWRWYAASANVCTTTVIISRSR